MASNKFFTNTYITGTGRQNYLRADYLEDPLFTSFTFDIDFISSPLFYTINNYIYPHPDNIGISEQIQNALGEMRKKMMPDQGYDILPLYSAEFLKGDKLGFGLQQNVYMDLPLYGATEYIYMVDKRNGDGSQNDVRYDDNSGSANNGGFQSYKLGDSVKEAVSESDKAWADTQNAQAAAQIADCNSIIDKTRDEHEKDVAGLETLLNECNITEMVDGEENPLTEEQLQQKINELIKKGNEYEQVKKDIANWVNGELSSYQNKAMSIYNQNECVRRIMSYQDDPKNHIKELENKYKSDFRGKFLYAGKENKEGSEAYIEKNAKLHDMVITYESGNGNAYFKSGWYKKDDGESLLVGKSDNKVIVRPKKIVEKFKKRLEFIGYLKLDKNNNVTDELNGQVTITPSSDAPSWTYNLDTRIGSVTDGSIPAFIEDLIITFMMYKCDPGLDFDSFDSKAYTENENELAKYQSALDKIRRKLYGETADGVCDISNPEPDSAYGKYLAAKEKCENDAYSQAMKTKSIAQSGMVNTTVVPDSEKNNLNNNTNGSVPSTTQQSSSETQKNPIVTPQTVLDMLGFISGMKKMTTEYPYIINGVTGLDKAYETHYGVKDPYMGSGDNKISLTCWESLDLRVTTMFNRYFNAVYDRQYRRERVPVNLRRFNCSVYVHDVRNFVTNNTNAKYENRMIELTDMYYSAIEFKFYDCEIVPEETGNIFNDISNEAPTEMKKTNFTFTYGNCVVNFVPQSEVAKYR